jgi:hypothetical protein
MSPFDGGSQMTDHHAQSELQPWRARSGLQIGVRQLAVLPLVFAGALLYWTMALSLGAFSLIGLGALTTGEVQVEFVGPSATGVEPMPVPAEGISVNIQESAEPEDVNDNAGAAAPAAAE